EQQRAGDLNDGRRVDRLPHADGLVAEGEELNVGQRIGAIAAAGHANAAAAEVRERVGGERARINRGVAAAAAVDGVVAAAARYRVVAVAARENVGGGVADDGVVAGAADGVFDGDAERDRDVGDIAANAAEAFGVEIDDLVLRVAGEIERVVAAGIPHVEDDFLRRRRDRIRRAGVRVEAVRGVAGRRRRVRAVEALDRGD